MDANTLGDMLKMPVLALLYKSMGEKQKTATLCHRILVLYDPRCVRSATLPLDCIVDCPRWMILQSII